MKGYSSQNKRDLAGVPSVKNDGTIDQTGTIIKSNLKEPLFIINGEIRSELTSELLGIEPDQIETISVFRWAEEELKDNLGLYFKGDEDELNNKMPLYGNRAKNGVISITTKD